MPTTPSTIRAHLAFALQVMHDCETLLRERPASLDDYIHGLRIQLAIATGQPLTK